MYIAGRTPRISAELQMHPPFAVGNPNRISMDRRQFTGMNDVAYGQLGHGRPFHARRTLASGMGTQESLDRADRVRS
jgi:hypothetical protein